MGVLGSNNRFPSFMPRLFSFSSLSSISPRPQVHNASDSTRAPFLEAQTAALAFLAAKDLHLADQAGGGGAWYPGGGKKVLGTVGACWRPAASRSRSPCRPGRAWEFPLLATFISPDTGRGARVACESHVRGLGVVNPPQLPLGIFISLVPPRPPRVVASPLFRVFLPSHYPFSPGAAFLSCHSPRVFTPRRVYPFSVLNLTGVIDVQSGLWIIRINF